MNINLPKNVEILGQFLSMHVRKIFEYRVNYAFEFIVSLSQFFVFYTFWKALLGNNAVIPGWNLNELVVLFSIQSLFAATITLFASGGLGVWKSIGEGELDKYLSRPSIPWLMLVFEKIRISFAGWIIGIGGLLLAHFFLGFNIAQPVLFPLPLMIFLAACIALFFALIGGTLVFWFGQANSFDRVWDGIFEFDRYPQTIFPPLVQTFTSFTIPFLFGSTIPTMAILQKVSVEEVFSFIQVEVGILIVVFFIFLFAWNAGVKRYESYGG